jgi:hypothetical protein
MSTRWSLKRGAREKYDGETGTMRACVGVSRWDAEGADADDGGGGGGDCGGGWTAPSLDKVLGSHCDNDASESDKSVGVSSVAAAES